MTAQLQIALAALLEAQKSLQWAHDIIGDIPQGSVYTETMEQVRGAIQFIKEA